MEAPADATDTIGWMRFAFVTGFEQALHNTSLSPEEFFAEWQHAGFPGPTPPCGLAPASSEGDRE